MINSKIKYRRFIPVLLMVIILFQTNISAFDTKSDSNQMNSKLYQRKNLNIDLNKFVSYTQIQHMLKKSQKYIFVDIRSKSDYKRIRIPKSINIQLYALKTKQYLKNKNIILANEGVGIKRLLIMAEQLELSGFHSIKILKNGLNSWHKSGGQLEGSVFEFKQLNRITPKDFFQDKDYKDIIVIEILKKNQLPSSLINNSFHFTITANYEKNLFEINKLISKYFQNSLYFVIICENIKFVNYIEKNINPLFSQSIFYMDKGIEVYKNFLQDQASIIDGNSRKKMKKGFCKTCGE